MESIGYSPILCRRQDRRHLRKISYAADNLGNTFAVRTSSPKPPLNFAKPIRIEVRCSQGRQHFFKDTFQTVTTSINHGLVGIGNYYAADGINDISFRQQHLKFSYDADKVDTIFVNYLQLVNRPLKKTLFKGPISTLASHS